MMTFRQLIPLLSITNKHEISVAVTYEDGPPSFFSIYTKDIKKTYNSKEEFDESLKEYSKYLDYVLVEIDYTDTYDACGNLEYSCWDIEIKCV